MLFARDWCVATLGWGFPFEVVHELYLKPHGTYTFEPVSVLGDLVFWGFVLWSLVVYPTGLIVSFKEWRKNRKVE